MFVDGRLLSRLRHNPALVGRQHMVYPVAHIPQQLHIRLNRLQSLILFRQFPGKLLPFLLQFFCIKGQFLLMGFEKTLCGKVSVQFLPVFGGKLDRKSVV